MRKIKDFSSKEVLNLKLKSANYMFFKNLKEENCKVPTDEEEMAVFIKRDQLEEDKFKLKAQIGNLSESFSENSKNKIYRKKSEHIFKNYSKIEEELKQLENNFVLCNLPLVIVEAKNYLYKDSSFTLLDLIDEGCIGAKEGYRRFKLQKGCAYSTYAVYWINQSIQKAIADNARLIRIPGHVQSFLNKIKKETKSIPDNRESKLTKEELAELMDFSMENLDLCFAAMNAKNIISLDEKIKGDPDSDTLGSLIVKEDNENALDEATHEKLQEVIEKNLSSLNPRVEKILKMRFGIGGYEKAYTLEEIGSEFNLTRERIRQIEDKALKQLKRRKNLQQFVDFNPKEKNSHYKSKINNKNT